MNELLGRISETRENRDKAGKTQMDEVRKLLKERGREEDVRIPECIFRENTEYDWEAITVMTYVLLGDRDPEYTIEQAERDSGQHTIRIMAPEISYYYGEKASKSAVEAHWDRIFEIVDSFDRCPHCNRTRIPAWFFCGWCGVKFISSPDSEDTEEKTQVAETENPTS